MVTSPEWRLPRARAGAAIAPPNVTSQTKPRSTCYDQSVVIRARSPRSRTAGASNATAMSFNAAFFARHVT